MAGFSHSVEDGSGATSVTDRDGTGTEEVDDGAAARVRTCCRGAEGDVDFGIGLR